MEIPGAKNHDIKIRRLKHHGIEKQITKSLHCDSKAFFRGQKSHNIEIPRLKTTTSRFQDQKATTLSFCGFLTLMLLDKRRR